MSAATPWKSRIVGQGEAAPAELKANAKNWRSHPKAQQKAMASVLAEVGWVQQLVVNRTSGNLIDGHLRLELALSRGEPSIPVIYVELSEAEEALILATLDPLAAMAETDQAKLLELLAGVTISQADLAAMVGGLAGMRKAGNTDPDDIPDPPDEPVTQPGDLWLLGEHRLLCGDAGRQDDLDRLLDGAAVSLLATDPPYNVKVEPRSNNAIASGLSSFKAQGGKGSAVDAMDATGMHHAGFDVARGKSGIRHHQKLDLERHPEKARPTGKMRAKDRPLTNDFVSDEAFAALLAAWFGNASRVMRPGAGFYIWGGYANIANYPGALRAAGLYFSQAVIWVKQHPVLTRKDFMGNHEWCFYGWREGAAHRFFGPANVPDVWSVKKVNPASMVHLTEKPVELARLAIEYSSLPGEAVLDLFAGSGSTIIAAEQTGRRGFGMELDPPYCDVIVQRWEAFTGRQATRG